MLVLSRKERQEVVITVGPHRIRLVVVEVDRGVRRVRLGFDADPEISIHRLEVQDQVDRERAELDGHDPRRDGPAG